MPLMVSHPRASRDPDAILEALAAEIARLIRFAAFLDRAGKLDEAAKTRSEARNLAHLLGLLRTEGGGGATGASSCASKPAWSAG